MMLVRYAAIFLATIGILVACLFFLLGAALVILPSCSGFGATSYTACTSGGSGRAWGIVLALVGVAVCGSASGAYAGSGAAGVREREPATNRA